MLQPKNPTRRVYFFIIETFAQFAPQGEYENIPRGHKIPSIFYSSFIMVKVKPSPSKENDSPSVRKTRRSAVENNSNSEDDEIEKAPKKSSFKMKDRGQNNTPKSRPKLTPSKVEYCDEKEVDIIQDITNEIKEKDRRRKASKAPSLDDVTEGSTEDDDEDTKETIAV